MHDYLYTGDFKKEMEGKLGFYVARKTNLKQFPGRLVTGFRPNISRYIEDRKRRKLSFKGDYETGG